MCIEYFYAMNSGVLLHQCSDIWPAMVRRYLWFSNGGGRWLTQVCVCVCVYQTDSKVNGTALSSPSTSSQRSDSSLPLLRVAASQTTDTMGKEPSPCSQWSRKRSVASIDVYKPSKDLLVFRRWWVFQSFPRSIWPGGSGGAAQQHFPSQPGYNTFHFLYTNVPRRTMFNVD